MSLLITWGLFAAIAAAITISGYFLSKYGDVIGDKTGLGGNWVGIVMLAGITSLPELTTGISAVTFVGAPDIAAGGIFGSCVFNMFILAILDFMARKNSVFYKASKTHLVSGSFSILLILIGGIGMFPVPFFSFQLAHFSLATPLIAALYLLAIKSITAYEKKHPTVDHVKSAKEKPITLKQAYKGFAIAGTVVVVAGTFLPYVADRVVEEMGWGQAFVGTIFVALATSLPEVSVTLFSFKLGAVNMAISNLIGSNLFNMLVFPVTDAFYLAGPILSEIGIENLYSVAVSILMTVTVMIAAAIKVKAKHLYIFSIPGFLLFFFYLLNVFLVYQEGVE